MCFLRMHALGQEPKKWKYRQIAVEPFLEFKNDAPKSLKFWTKIKHMATHLLAIFLPIWLWNYESYGGPYIVLYSPTLLLDL